MFIKLKSAIDNITVSFSSRGFVKVAMAYVFNVSAINSLRPQSGRDYVCVVTYSTGMDTVPSQATLSE